MSGIVDSKGNKVVIVATLVDGTKVSLSTKEQLERFFDKHPNAELDFIRTKGNK
jgi:hypothetical protein